MKSLIEFIKEAYITEGGHSVEGAGPIRGDLAAKVAEEIVNALKRKFGKDLPTSPLGSTGKKTKNQTSGDIDIAIEYPWENHKEVFDFINSEFNPVPGKTAESLHVFNIGYKYNDDGEEKIVQVDFMFVESLEFAKFCFHSPSFIPNEFGKIESNFKGAFRTQLMIACINSLNTEDILGKEYTTEYFTKSDYDGSYEGEIKKQWRILFNKVDGMKIKLVSYEGKNKPIKSPKTIEAKSYTKNINDILKMCFGDKATKDTMNSYESIIDFIFSKDYKWYSKEMLEKIFKWLFPDKGNGALDSEKQDMIDIAKEYFVEKLKNIK